MSKTEKKYFTQKELEKHINSRLMRERKKYGELEGFRSMTDRLVEEGIIDADSYAEAAEKIRTLLEESAIGNGEEKDTLRTAEEGTEPKSGKDGAPEDAVKHTDTEFLVRHGDGDAEAEESFAESEAFYDGDTLPFHGVNPEEYGAENDGISENDISADTEGRNGAYDVLSEICTSLLEIINNAKSRDKSENHDEAEAENGIKSARRNACSTGFSREKNAGMHSFSDDLTPLQRDIARRAGLSYREYSELLREIPGAKKRKQYR